MNRKTGRNRLKRRSAGAGPVVVTRASMEPAQFRALRIAAGLSQERLAEWLGISFTAVNRKENGHAPIRPMEAKEMLRLRRAS